MQIVIDIPEDTKNRLCFGITYQKDIQTICEALNDGTPIPDNATNGDELFDWVMANINAEKSFMGSCHDLADEEYHKGIIYAFECMKMKLM